MSKKYNQLDKNNKKTGLWKEKKWFAFHSDISKGVYVNGLKHGVWKAYSGGNLSSRIDYKTGRPCGRFVSYNQNGNVTQEILFII